MQIFVKCSTVIGLWRRKSIHRIRQSIKWRRRPTAHHAPTINASDHIERVDKLQSGLPFDGSERRRRSSSSSRSGSIKIFYQNHQFRKNVIHLLCSVAVLPVTIKSEDDLTQCKLQPLAYVICNQSKHRLERGRGSRAEVLLISVPRSHHPSRDGFWHSVFRYLNRTSIDCGQWVGEEEEEEWIHFLWLLLLYTVFGQTWCHLCNMYDAADADPATTTTSRLMPGQMNKLCIGNISGSELQ